MALNLEFFESAGTATAEGVFLPISDLIGVSAGEFADAESVETKENKLMYSLANTFTNGALTLALGLTATANNIAGQSNVLSSKSYSFTVQYYADHQNEVIDVLPLPTVGNQVGVSDIAFTDLFPNAVKVAAAGAVSGEGVVIPTAFTLVYGSPSYASLNLGADSRSYIGSLIRFLIANIDQRSAVIASAVTAKAISATAGLTLPAAATTLPNPTTGIDPDDLNKLDFFSKTMTITMQRIENETTQSFDVNVVTA